MIARTKQPEMSGVPQDETLPGPSRLVELRDIDFNFGLNDALELTLLPEDAFRRDDSSFYVETGEGQEITIERARVRWWSIRTRTVALPNAPLIPSVE